MSDEGRFTFEDNLAERRHAAAVAGQVHVEEAAADLAAVEAQASPAGRADLLAQLAKEAAVSPVAPGG